MIAIQYREIEAVLALLEEYVLQIIQAWIAAF